MGDYIIPTIFKQLGRKALVDRFNFLQQGNIGGSFVQPIAQRSGAGLDPVNVKARYFHEKTLWKRLFRIYRRST